ncbi:MAG: hypothetical protein WC781_00330 [Candidatus Pacearchaeota archaeon]|jgi:hypothetical protein
MDNHSEKIRERLKEKFPFVYDKIEDRNFKICYERLWPIYEKLTDYVNVENPPLPPNSDRNISEKDFMMLEMDVDSMYFVSFDIFKASVKSLGDLVGLLRDELGKK